MNDNKYVVFKREDFDRIASDKGTATRNELLRVALDDAVVIRKKDVFAPPALDMYANSILVALSMIGTVESGDTPTELTNQLRAIADYFHAQATDSWNQVRSLPTP